MSFILEYGKPGTGKTTMALTMTQLGYRVHFFDADNKLRHMMNARKLLDSKQVTYTGLKSKMVSSTLRMKVKSTKAALAKEPRGYLEFIDFIDALEAYMDEGKMSPLIEPLFINGKISEVLVIDSLTTIIEHFKRFALHLNVGSPKFDGRLQFDQWGMLLANLEEIFTSLQRLILDPETNSGLFKHIIVICHEKDEYEGSGDSLMLVGILPAIEGSMRDKVGKYFEEVYYLRTRQVGQEIKYEIITKPVNKVMARTSRELGTIEMSDFSSVFKEERLGTN